MQNPVNNNSRSKFSHMAFVFTLTLLVASIFSCIGIDEHHDGIMFKPALDVAEGKMLFRDTFTQYGALTTLLQACTIKLFGSYLIVIRLLTAFFYAMIAVLLWLIWSRFLPYALVTVSCVIWLLVAPYYYWPFIAWSSVYALFFLLLSSYWFVLHVENKSSLFLFLSGVSASLVFWFRQPVGVFLYAALVFVIISHKHFIRNSYKKMCLELALFSLGNIIILICFFCWLTMNQALHDWYLQSIKLAYVFANDNEINVRKIFTSLSGYKLSLIWLMLPLSSLLLLIQIYLKQKYNNNKDIIIYSIVIISCASWSQYYPVTCELHTYWAATPMIGLLTYVIWSLIGVSKIVNKITITILVLLIIFTLDIKLRLINGIHKLNVHGTTILTPSVLRGIKLTKSDAEYYEKIGNLTDAYLSDHPGRTIITNGPDALCLTFANCRENFHPVYVSWKILDMVYPGYVKKRNEFIAQKKPLIWGMNADVTGYGKLTALRDGYFLLYPDE